jgi:putative ABC transport system permease protein
VPHAGIGGLARALQNGKVGSWELGHRRGGGAAGAALAYAAFDNFRAATMNWQSFSQVTFAFAVTPALLVQGVVWATVIGLIGGLLPAIRAARMPIAAALREL